MSVDAGWLPDPAKRYELRYWNGTEWTEHVSKKGRQSTDGFLPSVPPAGSGSATTQPSRVAPTQTGSGALHGKGVTGRVVVDEHFVTITRKGTLAKANYGFTRGEKRIAIASITSVQYKKPGAANGYIQFSLAGGNESTKGILSSAKDENSVVFASAHQRELEAIRDHIERLIVARSQPAAQPVIVAQQDTRSVADHLRDLAQLRDEDILTDEELEAQKAKLLG